jgi:hypothetical protein
LVLAVAQRPPEAARAKAEPQWTAPAASAYEALEATQGGATGMSFTFDTLDYVRRLRKGNVPNEQAEAMADALQVTLSHPGGVATKADIARLANELVLHRWAFGVVIALAGTNLALTATILLRLARTLQ